MRGLIIPWSVASLALATVLSAQSEEPVRTNPVTSEPSRGTAFDWIPIHGGKADLGRDYGIWAAGKNYKVSFHGQPTFHPFVGSNAPTSFAWSTESVRVDTLELRTDGEPRGSHDGRTYTYDHGTFLERYEVRPEGVEQTFVFENRVERDGDLRIVGRIESDLRALERAPLAGPMTFARAEDTVRIGYGQAFVIDALGRTQAIATGYADGRIELVVPAAFLANATYPVTVDPLLTNQTLGIESGKEFRAVDVFRDDQEVNDNLWIVQSFTTSSNGDQDLVIRVLDENAPSAGTIVYSDITNTWSSEEPQIAGVGGVERTITVWTRDFGTTRRVRGHVHAKDDLRLTNDIFNGPSTATESDWRPDIGGTRTFTVGNEALLVWQHEATNPFQNTRESQVFGAIVTIVPGTVSAFLGPQFPLSPVNFVDQERPTVNPRAEGGSSFSWIVGWQEIDILRVDDWDIRLRRVDDQGHLSPDLGGIRDGFFHHVAPKIAGMDGRYVVALASMDANVSNPGAEGTEIKAQRFEWPHGADDGTVSDDAQVLRSSSSRNLLLSGLAFDHDSDSHWVAQILEGAPSQTLRAIKIGHRARVVEDLQIARGVSFTPVAGGVCYDDDVRRFPFVFAANDFGGGQTLLNFVTYETSGGTIFGSACSNTLLRFVGTGSIGDEFCEIEMRRMPASSTALLLFSLGSAQIDMTPFQMPGCVLSVDLSPGVFVATIPVPTQGGTVRLPVPILEETPPGSFFVQCLTPEPTLNPAGFGLSDGLQVTFGR